MSKMKILFTKRNENLDEQIGEMRNKYQKQMPKEKLSPATNLPFVEHSK